MKHTLLPATTNIANLKRMADYIETIPQDQFDMVRFRKDDLPTEHECNTVGCIIGYCTVLDEPSNILRDNNDVIMFLKWSENFTGLKYFSPAWEWLFGPAWVRSDNTPDGAARRIRYTIKNGLPENWNSQMWGIESLIY